MSLDHTHDALPAQRTLPVVLPLSAGQPLRLALELLSRAADYARDAGLDPWEFAVEIEELRAVGITSGDLRWLLARGYAAQAIETTLPDSPSRTFRPPPRSGFSPGTCFVLSPNGAATWRQPPTPAAQAADGSPSPPGERAGVRGLCRRIFRSISLPSPPNRPPTTPEPTPDRSRPARRATAKTAPPTAPTGTPTAENSRSAASS